MNTLCACIGLYVCNASRLSLFPSNENYSLLSRSKQTLTRRYLAWINCILVCCLNFGSVKESFSESRESAGMGQRLKCLRGRRPAACPCLAWLSSARFIKMCSGSLCSQQAGNFHSHFMMKCGRKIKDRISSTMKSVTRRLKGGN